MSYIMESEINSTYKDKDGNVHLVFHPSKANIIMMVDENGKSTDQTLQEFADSVTETLRDFEVSGSGNVISNVVTITTDEWVANDDGTMYSAVIENELIAEKYIIEVNIADGYSSIAEEAEIQTSFEYVDGSITLIANKLPTDSIAVQYIIYGNSLA